MVEDNRVISRQLSFSTYLVRILSIRLDSGTQGLFVVECWRNCCGVCDSDLSFSRVYLIEVNEFGSSVAGRVDEVVAWTLIRREFSSSAPTIKFRDSAL